ncbi:MAG: hypothetical protein II839_11065 [Kiritimatiellae bacterium]|nr:hypothetical protein [Kiritimatiellia bacterium]
MKRILIPVLLLALLAAVPLSLKPLFRARFERAEADAFAVLPAPGDTNGPAIPRLPDDTWPRFRGRLSNAPLPTNLQPPPAEWCAPFRAWCDKHPATIAVYERCSEPGAPVRPSRAFGSAEFCPADHLMFGLELLREAVARGDADGIMRRDRRLRACARLFGSPAASRIIRLAYGEQMRLLALSSALPILPDAYLDEWEADARERIRTAADDTLFALAGELSFTKELVGGTLRNAKRAANPFTRYFDDCDELLSAANTSRMLANFPGALARCEALFDAPRADFADGVAAALASLDEGMLEQWPRAVAIVKDPALYNPGELLARFYADARNRAEIELLALALERHRRRTGAYPARLADLVGGDEDALPRMFPSGNPPDYEAGDFTVRLAPMEIDRRSDPDDDDDGEEEKPAEPDTPTTGVVHGCRLRIRPSPRVEWPTDHRRCEFEPDCLYHIDLGVLHAEGAETESHAESAENAEKETHAEFAEGAESESHAESAEDAEDESHAEFAE